MTVPEFLSEGWFEAFAAALRSLPVTGDAANAPLGGLRLGQIITAVPDDASAAGVRNGEVRFTIVLGRDGSGSLVPDSTETADVTLVEDFSTAKAIASESASLPDLLGAGKIKLRGDARALVAAGDLLARLAPLVTAALGGGQAS
ncbi:MAG: hypothetical protein ABSF89_03550 [Acidimicrobiales bacterium]